MSLNNNFVIIFELLKPSINQNKIDLEVFASSLKFDIPLKIVLFRNLLI